MTQGAAVAVHAHTALLFPFLWEGITKFPDFQPASPSSEMTATLKDVAIQKA